MARSLFPVSMILAGCLLAACEDSFIDPFDNDNRYFTIYGYLDESKNFQPGTLHALRVVPISRSSQRIENPEDPDAQIDAEVFSINLATGQEVRWAHTLEPLADGSYGHVFKTRFFVEAGTTYRLEVRRSDGVIASAETQVPIATGIIPEIDEPVATEGRFKQDVLLPDVRSLWNVEIIYLIASGGAPCSPQRVSYGRAGTLSDDGWRLTVNLSNDIEALEQRLGNTDWSLCSVRARTRILDNAWTPPDDVFDPEVLAFPSALSNVENGYGFFGSVGVFQHDWLLSPATTALLGH